MIEILILYTIHKREKTIYGIRKDIIELFGTFTEPSIGTIYPALKRLHDEKAVTFTTGMTDGGKKSSYYSITPKGLELFRKLFFNSASDNPSLFFTHIQARLGTMGLLSKEDKIKFVNDTLRKIDIFLFGLEKKLEDEFIGLDYYQRKLHERTFNELKDLTEFVKNLKLDED